MAVDGPEAEVITHLMRYRTGSYVYPQEQNLLSIIFMGIGLWISIFLSVMRVNLIWWVFHPIGYIVANLE